MDGEIISSIYINGLPEKINLIIEEKKNPLNFLRINKLTKSLGNNNYFNFFDTRRVDTFVSQEIQGWNRQPHPRPHFTNPAVVIGKSYFESPSTGLSAEVVKDLTICQGSTINGKSIDTGKAYTRIDFTPGGRERFDRLKQTDSLAKGIKGIMELLDVIDQGDVYLEDIFVGSTNINMALIAQRLGFVIVDQCRTAEGQIDKNIKTFIIVGRLEDIRKQVLKLQEIRLPERLFSRKRRLQLISSPTG